MLHYFTASDMNDLIINSAFNVLTRQAFLMLLDRIPLEGASLVSFDIDNMKAANSKYGKKEVNKKLRDSFSFRENDVVAGQVFSGDEFGAIVSYPDAYGFCTRLKRELHSHGLSATIVILDYVDKETLEKAEEIITHLKKCSLRDCIVDLRDPV